jgi:hypothetical protein
MKFNKDTFLNDITSKVQSAIDKNLITSDDIQTEDASRLHGFIQYELLEYIEDRKFAIDVLKDFNYDEKAPWDTLESQFGKFESLMDIALVNLWKFLDAEGATKYDYYKHNSYDPSKSMLDLVHDMDSQPADNDAPVTTFDDDNAYINQGDDEEYPDTPDDNEEDEETDNEKFEPKRRKVRMAHDGEDRLR